jgi:molybdate transport system substrate-binding protein
MRLIFLILTILMIAPLGDGAGAARAAEIVVMSDTPVAAPLNRIGDLFQRDTGNVIHFVFDLSPAIEKKIADGQAADAIIVQPNFLADLTASGKIAAGDHSTIARVGIGLFSRAGTATPDISTVETFKQTLLKADLLVFSNVAGGNYFATVLEKMGIADTVKDKVVRANPSDVIGRVVDGKGDDIGVISMTLVAADKRLKLIGPLPAEYQSYLLYAAAPTSATASPEVSSAFVKFLTTPEAKKEFAAAGAE